MRTREEKIMSFSRRRFIATASGSGAPAGSPSLPRS
jgi:hypothetical protein